MYVLDQNDETDKIQRINHSISGIFKRINHITLVIFQMIGIRRRKERPMRAILFLTCKMILFL